MRITMELEVTTASMLRPLQALRTYDTRSCHGWMEWNWGSCAATVQASATPTRKLLPATFGCMPGRQAVWPCIASKKMLREGGVPPQSPLFRKTGLTMGRCIRPRYYKWNCTGNLQETCLSMVICQCFRTEGVKRPSTLNALDFRFCYSYQWQFWNIFMACNASLHNLCAVQVGFGIYIWVSTW